MRDILSGPKHLVSTAATCQHGPMIRKLLNIRAKHLILIVGAFSIPAPLLAQAAAPGEADTTVVYPDASRVGMIPFSGSQPAEDFQGFADMKTKRSVMIIELPQEAREVPLNEFVAPDAMKSQGVTEISRRNLKVADGASMVDAIEVRATQTAQGMTFPKCLVVFHASDFTALVSAQMPMDKSGNACDLIKGLQIRGKIGEADKLAALPFTIKDMAGFKVWDTVAGSSVMLSTERNGEAVIPRSQPMIVIARAFADRFFIPDNAVEVSVKSLHATTGFAQAKIVSKSLMDGTDVPTSEVIAETDDSRVVQWVQFQPDGYTIRIIAEAPKADFDALMPRFKAIRDGVAPRKAD